MHLTVLMMALHPLQWAESLFRELDYRREARNGIRFRELYGDLEVGDFSFLYLTPIS